MTEDYSILDLKVEPDTDTFFELHEDEIQERIDEAVDSSPIRTLSVSDDLKITERYIRFSLIVQSPNDSTYDEQYGLMGKLLRIVQEETSTSKVEVEVLKTGAS